MYDLITNKGFTKRQSEQEIFAAFISLIFVGYMYIIFTVRIYSLVKVFPKVWVNTFKKKEDKQSHVSKHFL